jgi:hypothetical protein
MYLISLIIDSSLFLAGQQPRAGEASALLNVLRMVSVLPTACFSEYRKMAHFVFPNF